MKYIENEKIYGKKPNEIMKYTICIWQLDMHVANPFRGSIRTYWLIHRDGFLSDGSDESRATTPDRDLIPTEKSGGM